MPTHANEECRAVQVARAFFQAATKLSEDNEDILPQEDGVDQKLSVFHLFSELFPEYANDKDRDGGSTGKSGLMRLQFNKIGYEMYDKEQSRRVPAVRAKPGNPGYGFRRARWRDTMGNGEDRRACENVLRGLGVSQERMDRIRQRISDFREEWDTVRRPSRPAGPGRPRGHKRANPCDLTEPMEAVDPLLKDEVTCASTALAPGGTGMGPGGHGAPQRKMAKKAGPCKAKPNVAGVAPKGGMGGYAGEGAGSMGLAGCGSGGMHAGSWKPPPGAESPEDYVLPPAQAQETGTGPVAAIVIDDDKSGLWQHSYHDRDASPVGNGGSHGYDDEEDSRHVHNLMDENSSLRSLNMSLIYEREKLLRELRQCDCEMVGMQRSVDSLLQTGAISGSKMDKNSSLLCQAFRWLCNKLVRKSRANPAESQEIPLHLRQVLEACFDRYDEFQRQHQAVGEEQGEDDDCGALGGMREGSGVRGLPLDVVPSLSSCMPAPSDSDNSSQQLQHREFNELALSKNGSPSEDLREELVTRGLQGSVMKRAPAKQESAGARHRRPEACEGLLGEGMEGMGARTATSASPNLGSAVKKQRSPALSDRKPGAPDADIEPVWASGAVCSLGESDVEIYDGDIGEIGNYDYLFSSNCPTTTAF